MMGLQLIMQRLDEALWGRTKELVEFEVNIFQGIDLFLVGTGCLILAIGMFSLFVRPLPLPEQMRVQSFHAVKGMFANFLILAMAISFLENLTHMPMAIRASSSNGSEYLYAGAGMALVTAALLAFKQLGGERPEHGDRPAATAADPRISIPTDRTLDLR
jgi:uncharacterized membrane protein YqhA